MNKLNYWFITGLSDANSSFVVNIIKDKTSATGYVIQVSFELSLNYKDKALLENIKYTLGVGYTFYNSKDKIYKFKVSNINELFNVIIPHFKKYSLITQKNADFSLFSEIVRIIKNKEHLTVQGLKYIVNLNTILNLRMSHHLIKNIPDIKHIPDSN